MSIYLTLFIPLSFKGEGEFFGRETLFLLDAPYSGLIRWGCLRGASAPLFKISPFPLTRGRGIKGDGVIRLNYYSIWQQQ
jgi:hypothetical protein